MSNQLLHFRRALSKRQNNVQANWKAPLRKHRYKLILASLVAYFFIQKDLTINLRLSNKSDFTKSFISQNSVSSLSQNPSPLNTSLLGNAKEQKNRAKKDRNNLANTYSNMAYTRKEFATGDSSERLAEKRRKQKKYVQQFLKVAQAEMEKYGIPVSITLAQGLLESNAGESKLALRNKNHFGIKCFSKTCKKGHCSNFTDDSHKDFFRRYHSAWESYRAHSQLLQSSRYKKLYRLSSTDYRGWALGLKKAGYATDKHYGEKLINLIEELELYKYDY